jgi:hypothetical protein
MRSVFALTFYNRDPHKKQGIHSDQQVQSQAGSFLISKSQNRTNWPKHTFSSATTFEQVSLADSITESGRRSQLLLSVSQARPQEQSSTKASKIRGEPGSHVLSRTVIGPEAI